MRRWLYVVVIIGVMVGGCSNKPKPLVPILSWTPGNCQDYFVVLQQAGTKWVHIHETLNTQVVLNVNTKGKTLTVAGVCEDGANAGEWQSIERVTW